MSNTTETNTSSAISEEFKDQNVKYNLSKFEYDLYHEEDDISSKVIRVKRFATSTTEKWKILEDNKMMVVIEGSKLSVKEKEFLRTPNGLNFLITQYKSGIKTFNAIKNEIKKVLK